VSLRKNFNHFKKGQRKFGDDIAALVNSVLLSFVYFFGVGLTFFVAKLVGKSFLDLKSDSNCDTYWEDLNLGKKPLKDYYRQF